MANYATLKAAIAAAIKQNGNNEITGNLLQAQLLSIVNIMGSGYQYMGFALPTTNPGTPDARVFYIATRPGVYTNFDGLAVAAGEMIIIYYDSSWHRIVIGTAGVGVHAFSGNGNVSGEFKYCQFAVGHKYRVTFPQGLPGDDELVDGYYRWIITRWVNGAETVLFRVNKNDAVPSQFVFTAVEADYYLIATRANKGTLGTYLIEDVTDIQADSVRLSQLAPFVPHRIFGYNNSDEWTPNTVVCVNPQLLRVKDFLVDGYIRFADLNDWSNTVYYSLRYYDANKQPVARTPFGTITTFIPLANAVYFSVGLGLHDSGGADIGGDLSNYNFDKIILYCDFRGEKPFVNYGQMAFNLDIINWDDGTGINSQTGAFEPNAKAIASRQKFKTSEFIDDDGFVTLFDANGWEYTIWYGIALYNLAGEPSGRLGFTVMPRFKIDPETYPYFAVSLGLHLGASDVGGNQADYNLGKLGIFANRLPAETLKSITETAISTDRANAYQDCARRITKIFGNSYPLLFSVKSGYGDAACYDGKIFQFINGNEYVYVHDAQTGALIKTITMPNPNAQYHNNSVAFGTKKYVDTDTFPLLYASQENPAQNKCIVYRVTGSGADYGLTVVQTITYPTPNTGTGKGIYYHNCYIDGQNNRIIVGGLMNGGWTWYADARNRLRYTAFELPDVSEGDVALVYGDEISMSPIYTNMPTTQGGEVKDGILYQAFGVVAPQKMLTIDLSTWVIKESLDITNEIIDHEPEGIFIYNNRVHIVFNGGAIYRID